MDDQAKTKEQLIEELEQLRRLAPSAAALPGQVGDVARAADGPFQSLLDMLPVMVAGIDPEGRIVFWNRECERRIGYSAAYMYACEHWRELLELTASNPDEFEVDDEAMPLHQRQQEARFVNAWGERRVLSWSDMSRISPVEGWDWWGIALDITRRVQAQDQLHAIRDELEDRVSQRTRDLQELNLKMRQEIAEHRYTQVSLSESRMEEQQFRQQLTRLHQVGNILSTADDLDALCRMAIEQGRSLLEFERLSIWFLDANQSELRGSFGVDEQGEIRDERHARQSPRQDSLAGKAISDALPRYISGESTLRNHRGEIVGDGGQASAPLLDGADVVGVLMADNLFSGRPFTQMQVEILRLFATSIGHLAARVRNESALRQSDRRFRTVTDATRDIIYDWDVRGDRMWVNNNCQAMLGSVPPEHAAGDWWSQRVHPRDIEKLDQATHQALVGEIDRWAGEYRLLRDDGSYAHVIDRFFMIRDSQGRAQRMIGAISDLTERVQAEEAIRRSEERFRAIAQAVPVPVLIARAADHTIAFCNDALLELFGVEREVLLDEPIARLFVDDDDRTAVMQRLETAGRVGATQVRALLPDASRCWLLISIEPMRLGEEDAFIWGLYDITAQKEAQEVARQHEEELAHVSRLVTVGEMASGLAHELNQPLAAIANYARGSLVRLDRQDLDPQPITHALKQIVRQSSRAGDIIRHLRALVRKRETFRGDLDINGVVRQVASFMAFDLQRHDVELVLQLSDDPTQGESGGPMMVYADNIQMEQVLINLIRNAAEAMSPMPRPARVYVRTLCGEDGQVLVEVVDHGPPIDQETLNSSFDPFVTTKEEGMGLGLAISHSIMTSHDGSLRARPNPEGGATFVMGLPAADQVNNARRKPDAGL